MNPFVTVLIILDIAAAIWYGYNKQYSYLWYWISAASITASTLFMKGIK